MSVFAVGVESVVNGHGVCVFHGFTLAVIMNNFNSSNALSDLRDFSTFATRVPIPKTTAFVVFYFVVWVLTRLLRFFATVKAQ
jgi:hypothetical protein